MKTSIFSLLLLASCAAGGGSSKCDSIEDEAAYQVCVSREEAKERADREYYRKQFAPKKTTTCETVGTRTVCRED